MVYKKDIKTEIFFENLSELTLDYLKEAYNNDDKEDFYKISNKLKDFWISISEDNFNTLYNIWMSNRVWQKIDILSFDKTVNDEWNEKYIFKDLLSNNIEVFNKDFNLKEKKYIFEDEKKEKTKEIRESILWNKIDDKDLFYLLDGWKFLKNHFSKDFNNNEELKKYISSLDKDEKNKFIKSLQYKYWIKLTNKEELNSFINSVNFNNNFSEKEEKEIKLLYEDVKLVKDIDLKNEKDILAVLKWWKSIEKYYNKIFKNKNDFKSFWDKKDADEQQSFLDEFNLQYNTNINLDEFNWFFLNKINFERKTTLDEENKIIQIYTKERKNKKINELKESIKTWEINSKEQLFWWLKWAIVIKELLGKNFLTPEQFQEYWDKNLSEKDKIDFVEKVKETQKIDLSEESVMKDFIKNINFVSDYNKDEIKEIIWLYHNINSNIYDWNKTSIEFSKKESIKKELDNVNKIEKKEIWDEKKKLDDNNLLLIQKINELQKLESIDWENVNIDIKEVLEKEIIEIQWKNKEIENKISLIKESKGKVKEQIRKEYKNNDLVHFSEKTDGEKLQKVDGIFHKISTGKISTKEDLYFNTIWWEEINKFFHKQNPEEQEKLQREIDELEKTRETVQEKLSKKEALLTNEIWDIDIKIEDETAKLEPLEETISALQSSVDDDNLSPEDKKRINNELDIANKEYSQAKLKVTNWQIEKAKKQRELSNYRNELESIDNDINKKTIELQKVSSFRDYDDFVEFLSWNHITDETEKEIFELEKKEFIKYLREKKWLNVDELSLAHYLRAVDFWLKLNDDEKKAISVEYKSKWLLSRNAGFIKDEYNKKLSEWNLQIIDKIQQQIAEKTQLLDNTENPSERVKLEKEIWILQKDLDEKSSFEGVDFIKNEIITIENEIKEKQREFNRTEDPNERWLIENEIKELKTQLWKKKHSLDMYRVDALSEVLTWNVSKRRNEILEQLENWDISLAWYEKMKNSLNMIKQKKSNIEQRRSEINNLKDWNIKRFKSLQLQKEQISLKREELKLDLWVANSLWPISILFYLVFNINQFVELGSFYFSYWIWVIEFYINKYFFHFFAFLIWYLSIVVFISDWVESNYMINPQMFSLYKFSSYNDFNISEWLKWWLIKLTIVSLLIFVIYFYYQIILIIRLTVNSIKDDWKADVKFIFRWIWYLILTLFYFTAFFNYNI